MTLIKTLFPLFHELERFLLKKLNSTFLIMCVLQVSSASNYVVLSQAVFMRIQCTCRTTRRASKGVTCSIFAAAPYECSQRGRAWLFLITAHAIKSHRVVASLKSSGARICKPFVKAATRRSWRLSRVISAQCRDAEGRDAWQFLFRHARRLLFISLSKNILCGYDVIIFASR